MSFRKKKKVRSWTFLNNLQQAWFNPRSQVQSNSFDVSKGLWGIENSEKHQRNQFWKSGIGPEAPIKSTTKQSPMRGCLAAPRRGQAAASVLWCGSVQSKLFRFRHFVRKIATVNPIPIPFSPTRSTQLILLYFSGKPCFQNMKTDYPRITYFPKTLKITFTSNPNFLPNEFSIPNNNQKEKIIMP